MERPVSGSSQRSNTTFREIVGRALVLILLLATADATNDCQIGVVSQVNVSYAAYQHSSYGRFYFLFYQRTYSEGGLQSYYYADNGTLQKVGEIELDLISSIYDTRYYVAQGSDRALAMSPDNTTGNLQLILLNTSTNYVSVSTMVSSVYFPPGGYYPSHLRYNSAANNFVFLNINYTVVAQPVPFLLYGYGNSDFHVVPSNFDITDFSWNSYAEICNLDIDTNGLVMVVCSRSTSPLTALIWNSTDPLALFTVRSPIPTNLFPTTGVLVTVYSHGVMSFGASQFMALTTTLASNFQHIYATYTFDGGNSWQNASSVGAFNITESGVTEVAGGYFNQWILTMLEYTHPVLSQQALVGPTGETNLSTAQWTLASSQIVGLGGGQKGARITSINSTTTLIKLRINENGTMILYSIARNATFLGKCNIDDGSLTTLAPTLVTSAPTIVSSTPTIKSGATSILVMAQQLYLILIFAITWMF